MKSSPDGVSPGPRPTSCPSACAAPSESRLAVASPRIGRVPLRRRCSAWSSAESGSSSHRSSGANPLAGACFCSIERTSNKSAQRLVGARVDNARGQHATPSGRPGKMHASCRLAGCAGQRRRPRPSAQPMHRVTEVGRRGQDAANSVRQISQPLGQQGHERRRNRSRCCTPAGRRCGHAPEKRNATRLPICCARMIVSGCAGSAMACGAAQAAVSNAVVMTGNRGTRLKHSALPARAWSPTPIRRCRPAL